MTRALGLLFLIFTLAVVLSPNALAVQYTVADVGTGLLGVEWVFGINNSGMVVGKAGDRGFVWSAASGFAYLDPLAGATSSDAYAINDSGQIVGYSRSDSGNRACLWEAGKPVQDLGTLSSAGVSTAYGINDAGQVVGGSTRAFLWSATTGMVDVGPADYLLSTARDINEDGAVVCDAGQSNSSEAAYVITSTGATYIDLPAIEGLPSVRVIGINDQGQVLCMRVNLFSMNNQPFVWQDGLVTPVGNAPGITSDINNLGQVVGFTVRQQGFVWNEVDGVQMLPMPSGYDKTRAFAINDEGVIAGVSGGHLIVWTPVPEPSSLLTLCAALGGVGALLRRRKRDPNGSGGE